MKKEYISPIVNVVFIETSQLMSASKLSSNPGETESVTPTETEYEGEGCARRKSVWDEDF